MMFIHNHSLTTCSLCYIDVLIQYPEQYVDFSVHKLVKYMIFCKILKYFQVYTCRLLFIGDVYTNHSLTTCSLCYIDVLIQYPEQYVDFSVHKLVNYMIFCKIVKYFQVYTCRLLFIGDVYTKPLPNHLFIMLYRCINTIP
jgi:hypothetical protein